MMTEYRVIWEIDVEADNPYDAAIEALKIQRDVESEALYFSVTERKSNTTTEIDILNYW